MVAILSSRPALSEVREYISQLYDTETRPELVANSMRWAGAEKMIGAEYVDTVASISTYHGLVAKASPYVEKVKAKEGRQELVKQAYDQAQPYVAKAAETATPYLTKAAPYLAKLGVPSTADELAATKASLLEKKAALVADKRMAKMLAALADARERPRETAARLKAECVSLVEYEKCIAYRARVQATAEAYVASATELVRSKTPAQIQTAATAAHGHALALKVKLGELAAYRARMPALKEALIGTLFSDANIARLDSLRARAEVLLRKLITDARVDASAAALVNVKSRASEYLELAESIAAYAVVIALLYTPFKAATAAASAEADVADDPPPLTPPIEEGALGLELGTGGENVPSRAEEEEETCEVMIGEVEAAHDAPRGQAARGRRRGRRTPLSAVGAELLKVDD